MSLHLGNIPAGITLYIPFSTYGRTNGESITLTGLAVTDLEIFKNGSVTQRSSDAGYALLDTDGIDFDGITGIHGFSIDLNDNTDAGFYAVGSFYWVVVSAVTIDGQTVNFIAATFRIVAAENVAGVPKADLTHIDGQATAGNNATLNLKKLNIVNNAGDAIVASSTGSNGHGIAATGNGSGDGIAAEGGATGHGASLLGGVTSGDGLHAEAVGATGNGIKVQALGADQHAIHAIGEGAGAGIVGQGGDTGGVGIHGVGGPGGDGFYGLGGDNSLGLAGHGFLAEGGSGGGYGLAATGDGAGPGGYFEGGATGPGLFLKGGATSGNGLHAEAVGGNSHGAAMIGIGAAEGLQAIGGAAGSGIRAIGGAAGNGIAAIGGTNGNGISALGGATSGGGIVSEAQADGWEGISGAGGPNGGIGIAGYGADGAGILGEDQGTNGDGIRATGVGTGADIDAAELQDIQARLSPLVTKTGAVVADGANSATTFVTDLTETATDYWKDAFLRLTSGVLVDQVKKITGYNGTTKAVTVAGGFTGIPAAGVSLEIIND